MTQRSVEKRVKRFLEEWLESKGIPVEEKNREYPITSLGKKKCDYHFRKWLDSIGEIAIECKGGHGKAYSLGQALLYKLSIPNVAIVCSNKMITGYFIQACKEYGVLLYGVDLRNKEIKRVDNE